MDKKIEELIKALDYQIILTVNNNLAGIYLDAINALQSQAQEIERLRGNVLGISADLEDCVEVAYNRGATEYVRLNYPEQYQRLNKKPKDT